MRAAVLALLFFAACTPHARTPQAWDFHPRPARGEIRVVPVVGTHVVPEVRLDGFVGDFVPWEREALRRERTRELSVIPDEVARALPGAVNGVLGASSDAAFRPGRLPLGSRDRIEAALRGRGDIGGVLSSVARGMPGDAVLFSWVTGLEGVPLTAEGFPGDIVETEIGPVVIDLAQEPYRVTAGVGMALVSTDGEVIVRYADHFEAVLSESRGARHVGRDLAMALASEVGMVWPCDPRLEVGEPDLLALR